MKMTRNLLASNPRRPDRSWPRRTMVSAATAAALATGAAAGSLVPTADAASAAGPRQTHETIRIVATGGASGRVDNKPRGKSIGDYFAFHANLENLSGERVGRVDGYSILTGTGKANGYLHFVTLTLPGGQITTQNTELPSIENGNGPEAITGGTGRYQGVGGQVTFRDRGDRVIIVVHILR